MDTEIQDHGHPDNPVSLEEAEGLTLLGRQLASRGGHPSELKGLSVHERVLVDLGWRQAQEALAN